MKAPLAVALLVTLTGPASHRVAVPPSPGTTLRIEMIDGSNPDRSIDVQTFTWGASAAASTRSGAAARRVEYEDLTVTINIDKAAPQLAAAVTTGKHFPRAILTIGTGAVDTTGHNERAAIELTDVLVTSFKWSATGMAQQGQVTLSYQRIEWSWGALKTNADIRGMR